VLRVHSGRLDEAYLEHWIAALGLTAQWELVARGGSA